MFPSPASIILAGLTLSGAQAAAVGSSCKAYPGTSSWPSTSKWTALNHTVSGKLEAVVPPGAACHNSFRGISTYNSAECDAVRAGWSEQPFFYADPVGVLWDFWTNMTCIPTQDPTLPCTIGTYPEYVIKATTVQDVQAGVNFARENNLRLVIKNTGHDFMGKSIGAGSLSIWTHQFKEIEIIDSYYDDSTSYTGSAVTLGSGWQTADIYNTLHAVRKVIVAGECAGVGFSGGYIQGGGHGPLSTLHGMGADQVLEFKLVTANGEYITANAKINRDLFWALRGGGGASWGVVTSVTVKTFDTPKVSGAVINFQYNLTTPTTFWAGIDVFHSFAPHYVEAGIFGYYELGAQYFLAKPLLAPGKTATELATILAPLFAGLDAIGVPYTSSITEHATFLDGYNALFDGEVSGLNMLTSSRLILKDQVAANHTAVTQAFRLAADAGMAIIGHIVSPGQFGGVSGDTSVNPIWKEGLLLPLYNRFWNGSETEEQQWGVIREMLDVYDQAFKDVSPGSGTYINEANIYEPNWANDFYGSAYPRLVSIKKKVDPKGVFYAKTAVGSEFWEEVDGRLCRI